MSLAEVESVMALVELDVRAAAARFLPSWTQDEEGVFHLDSAVADEVIDQFADEVSVILAFHVPPDVACSVTFKMVTFDGTMLERTVERPVEHPHLPQEGINISTRIE